MSNKTCIFPRPPPEFTIQLFHRTNTQFALNILSNFFLLSFARFFFIEEKLHVEHGDDPVQSIDRGGVGRTLQSHLRIRIRLLEDGHIPIPGCRVSQSSHSFLQILSTSFSNYAVFILIKVKLSIDPDFKK